MRKRVLAVFVAVLALSSMSCVSIGPETLHVDNVENANRLAPLEFAFERDTVVASDQRAATVQTDFVTVFTRELRQNLFDSHLPPAGRIDIVLTYYQRRTRFATLPIFAMNVMSFGFLPAIGGPIAWVSVEMEVEVTVYSSESIRLWNDSFVHEKRYFVSLYDPPNQRHRLAQIASYKAIAAEVRSRLAQEARSLNAALAVE